MERVMRCNARAVDLQSFKNLLARISLHRARFALSATHENVEAQSTRGLEPVSPRLDIVSQIHKMERVQ